MARSRSSKDADTARGDAEDKTPGEYMREALAHWSRALALAAAKHSPKLRALTASAKLLGAGRKGAGALKDLVPGATDSGEPRADEAEERSNGGIAVPIQESIEIAVPPLLAYELLTRLEDYPQFLDHVTGVELDDDTHATFAIKVGPIERQTEVEVFYAVPGQRLDWRSTGGMKHAGAVSLHELAPRLTHVELSIDREPDGIVPRLARVTRLADHAVRAELHRFKAYAELWEDEERPEEEPLAVGTAGEEAAELEEEEPDEAAERDEEEVGSAAE